MLKKGPPKTIPHTEKKGNPITVPSQASQL